MSSTVPTQNLTEDQAVEELAAILDAEPEPDDVLAHIHWAQDNAGRIQQLEQHIAHLQSLPKVEPVPALRPAKEDPTQPLPPMSPMPHKERSMPFKKDLSHRLQEYEAALEWIRSAPPEPARR